MSAAFEGAGFCAATGTFFGFTFGTLSDNLEFNSAVLASEYLAFLHIMTMDTHFQSLRELCDVGSSEFETK